MARKRDGTTLPERAAVEKKLACAREHNRVYREKNLEKIRTRNREYMRVRRVKFPEKSRESERRYAEKYPLKRKLVQKKCWTNYNTSLKGWLTTQRYVASPKGRLTAIAKRARRRANGYVTRVELERIRTEFGGRCAYCNALATCFDHVAPVTHGGTTEVSNLVPACRVCNSTKADRNWFGWFREQPFYTKSNADFIRQRLR